MNETIYTNALVETDLNRSNDGYEHLENDIKTSFIAATKNGESLFTTNTENLYNTFLENLPEEARQYYNCRACRNFVNRYGGLVTIDEEGYLHPIMWYYYGSGFFYDAVMAVRKAVMGSKVTGVFITSEKRLGIPKTGVWTHMSVDIPKERVWFNGLKTADQRMAEIKEEFRTLMEAVRKYSLSDVESAVNLLRSNSLYRGEKVLSNAKWFLELKRHQGSRRFANFAWKAVATAPAGFCHITSGVLGTLLDDIKDGFDINTIRRRFDEKMNPVKYQRPQTAPAAQNVARAEEIVAKLGIANSLKRRFARLDEVETLWKLIVDIPKPDRGGVFAGIKTKESINIPKPIINKIPIKMTWEKFQRTILPIAKKIEVKISYGRDKYAALVTAEDPKAPPIIKWDTEECRNPFSWYMYSGGSFADNWNLRAGDFTEVTGITLQPNLWRSGYEFMSEGVIFILKDCRDRNNTSSGLFPEILRGELREVRATIEAYSKAHPIGGELEADACGLCYQTNSDNWDVNLRVTTDVGVSLYKLDRWD